MRLLLTILLLLSGKCFAQVTPYSFHLDRVAGMPSETVFDVFQDSMSFIWFGTDQGICRYDGLQIKTYTPQNFQLKAVSNISQDTQGRIWFQNFNGTIYYIEDNHVKIFDKDKANGFLKYGFMNEQLFIAGKDALKIYRLSDFELIKTVEMDMNGFKHCINDDDHFYLVGETITSVNKRGEIKNISLPSDYSSKISGPLPALKDGNLYIFSKFGNNYLKISDNHSEYSTLPFSNQFIQNVSVVSGMIWLSSTKGIYNIHPDSSTYNHFFSGTNISNIIQTSSGKFWISSLNKGAYFVENFYSNFIQTENIPARLFNYNDQIFFSTNKDEIYRLDKNKPNLFYKGDSDHTINIFEIDAENEKLLISSSKFIIKSKNRLFEYTYAVKSISQLDNNYYAISASGWNGVISTDPNLKSEWDETFKGLPKHQIKGTCFISIVENENGTYTVFNKEDKSIYYLTNHGIKYFKNGQLNEIKVPANLSFTYMTMVNNEMLLLSEDDVVYRINTKHQLEIFEFNNGFSNEKIKKIRVVDNQVYFVKDGVLFKIIPNSNQPKAILSLHASIDFNDVTLREQQIYLATSKGIIELPKEYNQITDSLKLNINGVYINDVELDSYSQLNSDQNNIEISFDIIAPSPNRSYIIKYKIDNNRWESINNTDRILRFSSLSYGNHKIELHVENGSQIIERDFYFTINPPFWMTWWAITLAILLLIGLVYLYFLHKLRLINQKNEADLAQYNLERLVNQSKLKSLKSQMNPHFFYNALNTIQAYIFTNDKQNANNYLSKFSSLTRTILEMSEKDTVSLEEEIKAITLYLDLEKMRFSDNFTYHITIENGIENNLIELPAMLLQPYIENSIKHGLFHQHGNKTLQIIFEQKNDALYVSIDDNGIGRKRSSELNKIKNKNHKSFATEANEKRLEILNNGRHNKISIEITDKFDALGKACGTLVRVKIPLK